MITSEEVLAGQAIYTRRTLSVYDIAVLGFSNRLIWQCPTPRILAHFQKHISGNHLDVGVGTGYFLAHCRFPVKRPRIALMDLNKSSLEAASRRIARHHPEVYQRDLLAPINFDKPAFDSISLNYVLHCLPGTMDQKACAFDHLIPLLNPQATLFGSTLVQGEVKRSLPAQGLMEFYNRKGIFSNRNDTEASLRHALETRFREVTLERVGCALLFSARLPHKLLND